MLGCDSNKPGFLNCCGLLWIKRLIHGYSIRRKILIIEIRFRCNKQKKIHPYNKQTELERQKEIDCACPKMSNTRKLE